MRNYNGVFYRTDEVSKEPEQYQCPEWLELFATDLQAKETLEKIAAAKTAVEVARNRQQGPSVYEMVSSILGNKKPKYSSVEEAVQDYQRRTGLNDYLKRSQDSKLSILASQIVTASEDAEEEIEDESDVDDDNEDIEDESDADFLGLKFDCDDVREMTEEEQLDNPGKKNLISEANETIRPKLFDKIPAVEKFLNNIIETNYGIQLSAILHSLIETFNREGIDFTIFSDRDLLNWINDKLIERGSIKNQIPSNLGRGVGVHSEFSGEKDSNKDPFIGLTPDKNSM